MSRRSGSAEPTDPADRVARALLYLYPRSFRSRYGRDVRELFGDRLAEARSRGRSAVFAFWARNVSRFVLHGMLERASAAPGAARDLGASVHAAGRRLARTPGLSLVVLLTLGVGIGANVALFSLVRGVLLRPLPYPDADRLVQLWETNPEIDDARSGPSPWNFSDWEGRVGALEHSAAWYATSATLRTDDGVEQLRFARVTPDFFRVFGVRPLLGRDFAREEAVAEPLVLSHGLWTRRFGGDPDVVGRTVTVGGVSREIVGVMPEGFSFGDESVEAWSAWDIPTVYASNPLARTWRFLGAVGRLAPSATIETAGAELDAVAGTLAEAYPEMNRGWGATVTSLHEDVVGSVRGTLWTAFGAVLFILLIACANVANLVLARLPSRLAEVRVRATLGASRARIARDLTVEHLLLAVGSALLGLLVGRLLIDALVALDAGRLPRLGEVVLDRAAFGFAAMAAAFTTVAVGAGPLLYALRGAAGLGVGGLRSTATAGQRRLRESFVAVQIALATILLTGAGLFGASLARLLDVEPGIDPVGVASFRVALDPVDPTGVAAVEYYRTLLERLADEPGVRGVAAAQTLALSPIENDFARPFRPLGTGTPPGEAPTVQMRIVTPGYAETMGMTFLDGTGLPPDAAMGDPLVAVINRTLADRLFPSGGAVGRAFEIEFRDGWAPYRVVGVVEDVRHRGLRAAPLPEVFLSHRQVPYLAMHVLVRTVDRPELLLSRLVDVARAHPPGQPPHDLRLLEDLLRASIAEERFLSTLFAFFAAVGLLLSCTGVYGVIAYSVGHRRREIGVRMALGAEPEGVVRAVFSHALLFAGAGVLAGVAGAVALRGPVSGALYGGPAGHLTTTVPVAGALMAVAALSAWLPARRAAAVAPTEALKAE